MVPFSPGRHRGALTLTNPLLPDRQSLTGIPQLPCKLQIVASERSLSLIVLSQIANFRSGQEQRGCVLEYCFQEPRGTQPFVVTWARDPQGKAIPARNRKRKKPAGDLLQSSCETLQRRTKETHSTFQVTDRGGTLTVPTAESNARLRIREIAAREEVRQILARLEPFSHWWT